MLKFLNVPRQIGHINILMILSILSIILFQKGYSQGFLNPRQQHHLLDQQVGLNPSAFPITRDYNPNHQLMDFSHPLFAKNYPIDQEEAILRHASCPVCNVLCKQGYVCVCGRCVAQSTLMTNAYAYHHPFASPVYNGEDGALLSHQQLLHQRYLQRQQILDANQNGLTDPNFQAEPIGPLPKRYQYAAELNHAGIHYPAAAILRNRFGAPLGTLNRFSSPIVHDPNVIARQRLQDYAAIAALHGHGQLHHPNYHVFIYNSGRYESERLIFLLAFSYSDILFIFLML